MFSMLFNNTKSINVKSLKLFLKNSLAATNLCSANQLMYDCFLAMTVNHGKYLSTWLALKKQPISDSVI